MVALKTTELETSSCRSESFPERVSRVDSSSKSCSLSGIKNKIENSLSDFSGKTFLHTSPHHDDVMLAYLPFLSHLVSQKTQHNFAVMAGGSNSVTDEFLIKRLNNLEKYLDTINTDNNGVKVFLDALAENNFEKKEIAQASRLAHDVTHIFGSTEIQKIIEQIKIDLGQKQSDKIKELKAKIRDWEEELTWGMLGFDNTHLNFMKLGFYSDQSGQVDFHRDVIPVINLIKKINPDIITLSWENEVGHPTHIKVCKIVMQAIKCYLREYPDKKISVWGYRNVWCRFEPYQTDLIFPVTLSDFSSLKNTFLSAYGSQVRAATPSPDYDGPFCDFMQKIMHEQYQDVKSCIGREYFDNHKNQRVRAASGLCFIKFIEDFV